MNPRVTIALVAALGVLMIGTRFVKVIPAGHVGVAKYFGQVQDVPYAEGIHIVNPLLDWVLFDVRQNSHKDSAQVPTRDQLQTKVDVSIQYRIDGALAPSILRDTGDAQRAIAVHLIPTLRSLVREQGSKIQKAEDFFQEETREQLAVGLLLGLQEGIGPKGIKVETVLIRDVNLPPVLTKAIEQKKEREQAVERQKAELNRFRQEQQQQVAAAEAKLEAARQEAQQIRVLAEARAAEIKLINDAASKSPTYVQLQALEALKQMSKDPAAKLYFMDSGAPQPLPLMHMGDQ